MKAGAKGALELDDDTQAYEKLYPYLFSFFCLLFSLSLVVCKKREREKMNEFMKEN